MLAPVAGARPSTRGAVELSPHSFRIGVNISQKMFLLLVIGRGTILVQNGYCGKISFFFAF
jgi:hypothetical protein